MFFRKKSEVEKLEAQYKKLLEESFTLSTQNRKLSDEKYAEAQLVWAKIEQLKSAS